ncbi:putative protein modification by small protein conjugation or removal [Lyophyllum shimeji]|uniref:WD40 repeat-like protein n=1 Tax=Lyophyllum shimeji TaxID=47721 RepID=A0A9P3UMD1_LYOSH|nr:putative protein modification by small protein conjugation or removal [Lyophyllum shimeji]
MPAELPGLYWDAERNRYFPLASKPKPTPKAPTPAPTSDRGTSAEEDRPARHLKRKRTSSRWHITESARTTCYSNKRHQAVHEILCSQYADTARRADSRVPIFGSIKAFCSTTLNGRTRRFIGDDRGWLYTSTPLATGRDLWCADLNLHPQSQISSICVSGSRYIATCFGPAAKISVQDLNVTGRTSLLSLNSVHDIRCSHLHDSALVLGVSKKAVYLPDIDTSMSIQHLETHSDVFSVRQHGDNIYTGCRNGTIMRFDKRLYKHGQKLYNDRFLNQPRTTVLHVEMLGDWQLLTSHMNGDLMTFDLRFTRQDTPLVRYHGHTNTYTQRLGIALDPDQKFLFAAGEDNRIRGWSIRTGDPLLPSSSSSISSYSPNPFAMVFPGVVESMQVTAEQEGLCLWAAQDQTLYQFHLGQR